MVGGKNYQLFSWYLIKYWVFLAENSLTLIVIHDDIQIQQIQPHSDRIQPHSLIECRLSRNTSLSPDALSLHVGIDRDFQNAF